MSHWHWNDDDENLSGNLRIFSFLPDGNFCNATVIDKMAGMERGGNLMLYPNSLEDPTNSKPHQLPGSEHVLPPALKKK